MGDPQVVVGAYPYAAYPYAAPAVVPATQSITYKTITPTVETNVVATNAAVPVAVGGYKAVAGDNGELKGAVHEVPAIFGAPALNAQVNDASQGSLTVGTSAVITHTVGEPIVKELRPRPTPTSCTVDTTDMATDTDTPMPMATTATTARGVLMLSPRLMLIPTFCTVATTATALAMAMAMATPMAMEDTTTESRPLKKWCKLHPA